jgi:hypothetical protein
MENNKKQTAVEWLTVEAMKLFTQAMTGTLNEDTIEDDVSTIITKAKAMEKEQISIAYKEGWNCPHGEGFPETGEQYYNETYIK